MNTTRSAAFSALIIFMATLAGCERKTATPSAPAPQTVSGMTRDRTSYTFLKWNEGLAIMLVDHCDVHEMSSGNASGKPYQCRGRAYWRDRNADEWKDGYEWKVETHEGRTAQFSVNDVQYPLERGRVFRIDAKGGQITVKQLDHDLVNVQPDHASCDNFVTADFELTRTPDGLKSD